MGGRFSDEQRILYDLVLEAQLQAIAAVKPGAPFNEFHDAATKTITAGLVELGLLRGEVDTLIEEKKAPKPSSCTAPGTFWDFDVH